MGWGSQPRKKLREEMRMEVLEIRNFASLENIFLPYILPFIESFPYPARCLLHMVRSGSWLCFGISKFMSSVDLRAALW